MTLRIAQRCLTYQKKKKFPLKLVQREGHKGDVRGSFFNAVCSRRREEGLSLSPVFRYHEAEVEQTKVIRKVWPLK